MSLFTATELKNEAQRYFGSSSPSYSVHALEKSAQDSPFSQRFDIFMSHSINDGEIIYGLKKRIERMGYTMYIDWDVDRHLDRSRVNKETAQLLKYRMQNSFCLFYATSDNSLHSIWMPWELGYFDGLGKRIAILPISYDVSADYDSYIGREYLGLYPYLTIAPDTTNIEQLWINESPSNYVWLNDWLDGKEPIEQR